LNIRVKRQLGSHSGMVPLSEKERQTVETGLELIGTLDHAWNSQDWEVLRMPHTQNTAVYWPSQPDPTKGSNNYETEAREFFKSFPDNHLINNPCKIFLGQGTTFTVAYFSATMQGPMIGAEGR
jgi:hypothetical protein